MPVVKTTAEEETRTPSPKMTPKQRRPEAVEAQLGEKKEVKVVDDDEDGVEDDDKLEQQI